MNLWKDIAKCLGIFVGPFRRKLISYRKYDFAYEFGNAKKAGSLLPLLSKFHMMVSTDRFCVPVTNAKDVKMSLKNGILNNKYMGAIGGNSDEMWLLNFENKGIQPELKDFGWSIVSPTLQQTCTIALEKSPSSQQKMNAFEIKTLRFFESPNLKWTLEPEIPPAVPALLNK